MKFIIIFSLTFVGALIAAGIIRSIVLTSENDETNQSQTSTHGQNNDHTTPKTHNTHNDHQSLHKGHGNSYKDHGKNHSNDHSDTHEHEIIETELNSETVDLKNPIDPVTGNKIQENSVLSAFHKGFIIHFSSKKSKQKFLKQAIKYYAKLSLEPLADGTIKKVDTSQFRVSVTPEKCPIMGGGITPKNDVYILHRGFKIYFCCWSGCYEDFLTNPENYYNSYGLEEKNGALVLKE